MPLEPKVLLGLVAAIGTFAFVIGAMFLGGGTAAVRRQIGRITLLGFGLLAVALILPTLEDQSGGAFATALFAISVILIAMRTRREQRQPPEVLAQRTAIMRSARGRLLIWAFIGFVVFMAVFAAILGRLNAR